MGRFIQLHALVTYPPSNLNRDDLGSPKSAMFGGVQRLRISSQCLKRAWRTSEVFQHALDGHLGTRTRWLGRWVVKELAEKGVSEDKATQWAGAIAGQFGKLEKATVDISQLAMIGHDERAKISALIEVLAARGSKPTNDELSGLHARTTAVDTAMFGRMMADMARFNTEAAVQVAHAISVNRAPIESDYFTAVEELNEFAGEHGSGAGHLNETEFGAGTFYLYVCINRPLLVENIGGDEALANKAIRALIETMTTVSPKGKQASFGSRARASFLMVETGDQQPRSLVEAFLKPTDQPVAASEALLGQCARFDQAYGDCADTRATMNVLAGKGTLAETIAVATGA